MYFDFQEISFKNFFSNFRDKIFCKKRKRQEIDFNYNYSVKKRSQTPLYFDDTNHTTAENYGLSNYSARKSFQNLHIIKFNQRSSSCGNKSTNISRSHLEENKSNLNEQITNLAVDTTNWNSNLIKEDEKELIINKPSGSKPKLVFKTNLIKSDHKINENMSNKEDNEKNEEFDNYESFINYSRNKDLNSFPNVDLESFETFIRENPEIKIHIPEYLNMHSTSLLCLKHQNWINDEIINSYAELLVQRSKNKNYSKFYIFNTFFYQSLEKEINEKTYNITKYKKRFEKKKINFSDYKCILIPVNLNNNHWVLIVVDLKNKNIACFDSCSIYGDKISSTIMSNITKFFEDLHNIKSNYNTNLNLIADFTTDKIDEDTTNTNKEKSVCSSNSNIIDENLSEKAEKNITNWKFYFPDCPKQNNFSDCGMFVCKFMDNITREQNFDFCQDDMEFLRVLLGIELIKGNVLTI